MRSVPLIHVELSMDSLAKRWSVPRYSNVKQRMRKWPRFWASLTITLKRGATRGRLKLWKKKRWRNSKEEKYLMKKSKRLYKWSLQKMRKMLLPLTESSLKRKKEDRLKSSWAAQSLKITGDSIARLSTSSAPLAASNSNRASTTASRLCEMRRKLCRIWCSSWKTKWLDSRRKQCHLTKVAWSRSSVHTLLISTSFLKTSSSTFTNGSHQKTREPALKTATRSVSTWSRKATRIASMLEQKMLSLRLVVV